MPNRGKALEGWTRPSIDEMGVPTESWAKVNRWYHGGGGHELDSRHVDHADEEGDGSYQDGGGKDTCNCLQKFTF